MKDDYTLFRSNIKKVRSFKGIASVELSKLADLRQQKRVSDIEDGRGSPELEEVIKICRALDCSLDDMLFKEPQLSFK